MPKKFQTCPTLKGPRRNEQDQAKKVRKSAASWAFQKTKVCLQTLTLKNIILQRGVKKEYLL